MPADATFSPALRRFSRAESQVDALRAICARWQTGAETFWAFDDVLAALSLPTSTALFAPTLDAEGVAAEAGPWRGFIMADVGPYSADLLYVYVCAEARRAGLGRQLFDGLLADLARRPQLEALLLEVRAANAGAQALYVALGMTLVGRRRAYYRDGEDALIFRAALQDERPR